MMNRTAKQIVLFLVLAVIFGAVGREIYKKEMTLVTGQIMLLELAPLDPRSLMQGDYMALRYKVAQAMPREGGGTDGCLVMKVDENGVASFGRVYTEGTALAPGEHLLRYRKRGTGIRLGAESFFFQEGHARFYNNAKYGELRVDESGNSVLAGLRGQGLERLGPESGRK
jgi:uncharacterized membrane-anchored protein